MNKHTDPDIVSQVSAGGRRQKDEKRKQMEPERKDAAKRDDSIAENKNIRKLCGTTEKERTSEEEKFDFWLASLHLIRSDKRLQAQKLCGSARELFGLRKQTIEAMHLFTETEILHLTESRNIADLDRAWERFLKTGIKLVPYDSEQFPDRLRHIPQPPYALFGKGAMPAEQTSVGIVGARMCSDYGRNIATALGKMLALHDIPVISGLALGIDSASHAGALQGQGRTFAVLGCGCDICYPKNAVNLYRNIPNSGGGILSEYPPGTKPLPYRFPERNRIISGLSNVLVVVEAKKKSGSLITSDFALEQGRDVFAVPGRIGDKLSEGCNALIAQGAGILNDFNTFLQNLGITEPHKGKNEKNKNISLAKNEQLLYSQLDLHPKFVDLIMEETGLDLPSVLQGLDSLKQYGLIQETFQNYFSRML